MIDHKFEGLIGEITRFDEFESKFVIPRSVDIWTATYIQKTPSKDLKFYICTMAKTFLIPPPPNRVTPDWGIDETMTCLMSEQKIQTDNSGGHVVDRETCFGVHAATPPAGPGT